MLNAQQLIASKPASYTEQQVRALIGMARVGLATDTVKKAQSHLQAAEKIITQENLTWWLPAAAYLQGQTSLALADKPGAKKYFLRALSAVERGGRPECLPLILLKLGQLTSDTQQKPQLLQQCLESAEKRARHLDRLTCYREAGEILAKNNAPQWQQMGQHYLELAKALADDQVPQKKPK